MNTSPLDAQRGGLDPEVAAASRGPRAAQLATNEPVLYWAGNTILCREVEDVIAVNQPDVIVVHACGANWKGAGPLVMDETMTEQVLRLAPEAPIVATHLDGVDHATVSRASLKAHFAAYPELKTRLHIPEDGETMSFEKSPITQRSFAGVGASS